MPKYKKHQWPSRTQLALREPVRGSRRAGSRRSALVAENQDGASHQESANRCRDSEGRLSGECGQVLAVPFPVGCGQAKGDARCCNQQVSKSNQSNHPWVRVSAPTWGRPGYSESHQDVYGCWENEQNHACGPTDPLWGACPDVGSPCRRRRLRRPSRGLSVPPANVKPCTTPPGFSARTSKTQRPL
jgi:hypothetical protein